MAYKRVTAEGRVLSTFGGRKAWAFGEEPWRLGRAGSCHGTREAGDTVPSKRMRRRRSTPSDQVPGDSRI